MIPICLAYFAVGLVRDAMAALYYRSVSGSRALSAGSWGGGLTAYDIVVLALLIQAWSWPLVAAYSLGTGLGTYIIVKFYKEG